MERRWWRVAWRFAAMLIMFSSGRESVRTWQQEAVEIASSFSMAPSSLWLGIFAGSLVLVFHANWEFVVWVKNRRVKKIRRESTKAVNDIQEYVALLRIESTEPGPAARAEVLRRKIKTWGFEAPEHLDTDEKKADYFEMVAPFIEEDGVKATAKEVKTWYSNLEEPEGGDTIDPGSSETDKKN